MAQFPPSNCPVRERADYTSQWAAAAIKVMPFPRVFREHSATLSGICERALWRYNERGCNHLFLDTPGDQEGCPG
jgi:hypothetical protein